MCFATATVEAETAEEAEAKLNRSVGHGDADVTYDTSSSVLESVQSSEELPAEE